MTMLALGAPRIGFRGAPAASAALALVFLDAAVSTARAALASPLR